MAAFYKSFNKQKVYWHKGNNIKKIICIYFSQFLKEYSQKLWKIPTDVEKKNQSGSDNSEKINQ